MCKLAEEASLLGWYLKNGFDMLDVSRTVQIFPSQRLFLLCHCFDTKHQSWISDT